MAFNRIVIDKRILEGFKKRAFKAFPHEHIEAMLGTADETLGFIYIYAFGEIEKINSTPENLDYFRPEEEIVAGTRLKYFGTLHTHPKADLKPSGRDWDDFLRVTQEEECLVKESRQEYYVQAMVDEVMGIMYVDKKGSQRFFGCSFFNRDGDQIEFIISEKR